MKFQTKNRSEKQIIIELIFFFFSKLVYKVEVEHIIKKVFEDLKIDSPLIKYNSSWNRFMIKPEYDFGNNIQGWIALIKQKKIEIESEDKPLLNDIVAELLVDHSKGLKKLLQVVRINDETLGMELLRCLLKIKDSVMYVQFEIRDERVRKLIQDYKWTISKIKKDIKDKDDY